MSILLKLRLSLISVGFVGIATQILGVYVATFFFPQGARAVAVSMIASLSGLAAANWVDHKVRLEDRLQTDEAFFLLFTLTAYFTFTLFYFFEPVAFTAMEIMRSSTLLSTDGIQLAYLFLCFVNLFIPSFILGFLFPRANDWILKVDTSKTTSWANFQDLAGATLGAVVMGYFAIPNLGVRTCALLIFFICIGTSLLWVRKRATWVATIAVSGLLIVSVGLHLREDKIDLGLTEDETLIFQRRSDYGVVSVLELKNPFADRALYINYRDMCFGQRANSEEELGKLAIAHVNRENLNVVNIGLGCGMTASRIASSPKVKSLEIVEINPVVAAATSTYFRDYNRHVLESPKTKLHIGDGFSFLNSSSGVYDAIVMDIEEPNIIQSTALFTADFFEIVRNRLMKDGMFTVWSFYDTRLNKAILNTLQSVFPHVSMIVVRNKMIFLASKSPFQQSEDAASKIKTDLVLKESITAIATISNNPYGSLFPKGRFRKFLKDRHDPQVLPDSN